MKRLTIILIITVVTAIAAMGQSKAGLYYSIGFGTGDMGDFIDQTSFRGFMFDYRYLINPNVAVGATVGWNTFYAEEPNSTYTLENESLTGKQYRYSNSLPMLAAVTYYLRPEEMVSPFVGLGIGTMYLRRNTEMNLYTWEQEAWPFVLQPEIGVEFKTIDNTGFVISLKYMHGFEAGDFDDVQSYLALNLGFTFF